MARLIVTAADGSEHVFELGPRTTVGRHPGCQLQILDKLVSKEHFTVDGRSDGHWIQDLGTLNGTYVNGVRLMAARRLAHLDEIGIGSTRLLFSDPEDAMRRSPSANLTKEAERAREPQSEVPPRPPADHPTGGDLVSLRRFYALCRMLSAESNRKQLAADATHGLFSLCLADWAVLCTLDSSGPPSGITKRVSFVELARAGREKPPENLGPFPALFDVAVKSRASTFQASPDGALQLVAPLVHAERVSGVFWIGFTNKAIEIGPVIELLGTYGSFVAMALRALDAEAVS